MSGDGAGAATGGCAAGADGVAGAACGAPGAGVDGLAGAIDGEAGAAMAGAGGAAGAAVCARAEPAKASAETTRAASGARVIRDDFISLLQHMPFLSRLSWPI